MRSYSKKEWALKVIPQQVGAFRRDYLSRDLNDDLYNNCSKQFDYLRTKIRQSPLPAEIKNSYTKQLEEIYSEISKKYKGKAQEQGKKEATQEKKEVGEEKPKLQEIVQKPAPKEPGIEGILQEIKQRLSEQEPYFEIVGYLLRAAKRQLSKQGLSEEQTGSYWVSLRELKKEYNKKYNIYLKDKLERRRGKAKEGKKEEKATGIEKKVEAAEMPPQPAPEAQKPQEKPRADDRIRKSLDFYIDSAYERFKLEGLDESNLDEINSLLEDSSKLLGKLGLTKEVREKYEKRIKIARKILNGKYEKVEEENYLYYSTLAQHIKANVELGVMGWVFAELRSLQSELSLFRMPEGKKYEIRQVLNSAWDLASEKHLGLLGTRVARGETILAKKKDQLIAAENELRKLEGMKNGSQSAIKKLPKNEIERYIAEKQALIQDLKSQISDIEGKTDALRAKINGIKGKQKNKQAKKQ